MSNANDLNMGESSSKNPADEDQSPGCCWDELVSSLNAVKTLENFSFIKTYPGAVNPVIQINEDIITLPLTNHGAEIIKQADRCVNAGHGSIDGIWKLDAKNFNILHPDWPLFLETVLDEVRNNLNITESVDAQLYELILCEQDGLSQWQNETGKYTSMAAMLTIYLPSAQAGGVIRLSHTEQHRAFDLSELSMFATRALAWLPNAGYEAEAITSGRCLILNYGIIDQSATIDSPSSIDRQTDMVTQALRQCVQQAPHFSAKIYMFDHKYPHAELLFNHKLKGHDRAVYRALKESCLLHGLYLLLGRLETQRTTLDVDSDINESVLRVDILDGEGGLEIAKKMVFTNDQILKDPYREDRIAGNIVPSGSSVLGDTAAIICPIAHLASCLDLSQSIDLANIIYLVMRDIDVISNACGYLGDSLRVLEAIVDSRHNSNLRFRLPSNILARVIRWAWGNRYRGLFIKILSSEMNFGMDFETTSAVAQIINTDILKDTSPLSIPWDKYFVGTFHSTQNLHNVVSSLNAIGNEILDSRKPSFGAWKRTIQQHLFRNNVALSSDNITYFLRSIVPDEEKSDWVLNCLIPALRAPERKQLLRESISDLLHDYTRFPHIADKVILCTYSKAALDLGDFQGKSYNSSPVSLFAHLVDDSLQAGLITAVTRLLDASWINIAACHTNPYAYPLFEHRVIIIDFLGHLGSMLRDHEFPFISSTREIFKLLVRRYIYAEAPSYPLKLPGWAHKPRGCGCKICLELDEFLISEKLLKKEFNVEDIDHLESQLPCGIIRCMSKPRNQFTKVLYKLKDKEFEQDVESYNEQVSAFEEDVEQLRNNYIKGLFGEADYRKLIMLERVQNMEGQKQLATAAADGKKRKAGEDLFNGGRPGKKRTTYNRFSSSEDDADSIIVNRDPAQCHR
ncbi:hypothetical protein F4680DRAFT_435689 [Xylaria scruposa]|nr:hypothetical protein F4680DRAFT_435689 [Xylaria scruposa]